MPSWLKPCAAYHDSRVRFVHEGCVDSVRRCCEHTSELERGFRSVICLNTILYLDAVGVCNHRIMYVCRAILGLQRIACMQDAASRISGCQVVQMAYSRRLVSCNRTCKKLLCMGYVQYEYPVCYNCCEQLCSIEGTDRLSAQWYIVFIFDFFFFSLLFR